MFAGLLIAIAILSAAVLHNYLRSRIHSFEDLSPNRLMTRYPLVFVTGKRSLFYFLSYWNKIPDFLASYGYEVYTLPTPWRKNQKDFLFKFLTRQSEKNQPIHLVFDESIETEITELLEEHFFPALQSATKFTVANQARPQNLTSPLRSRTKIPIEELELPIESKVAKPLFWRLHLLASQQPAWISLQSLGIELFEKTKGRILDRCQFLAEKDLLQGQRSNELILK